MFKTIQRKRHSSSSSTEQQKQQQQYCLVCGDSASGVHYGALACEGCKGFFRRCLTKGMHQQCTNNEECEMNKVARNSCQFCRLKKCLVLGMSRQASKLGRRPKFITSDKQREKQQHENQEENDIFAEKSASPSADVWKFLYHHHCPRQYGTEERIDYKSLYLGQPSRTNVIALAATTTSNDDAGLYDGEQRQQQQQQQMWWSSNTGLSNTTNINATSSPTLLLAPTPPSSSISCRSSIHIQPQQQHHLGTVRSHDSETAHLHDPAVILTLSESSMNAECSRLTSALDAANDMQRVAPHFYLNHYEQQQQPQQQHLSAIFEHEEEILDMVQQEPPTNHLMLPDTRGVCANYSHIAAQQHSSKVSAVVASGVGGNTVVKLRKKSPSLYSASSSSTSKSMTSSSNRYSMISVVSSTASTTTHGQYSLSESEKETLIDSLTRLVLSGEAPLSPAHTETLAGVVNEMREIVAQAFVDVMKCENIINAETSPMESSSPPSPPVEPEITPTPTYWPQIISVTTSEQQEPRPGSSSMLLKLAKAPRRFYRKTFRTSSKRSSSPAGAAAAAAAPSAAAAGAPAAAEQNSSPTTTLLAVEACTHSKESHHNDDSLNPVQVWNESFIPRMQPMMLKIVEFCRSIPGFSGAQLSLDDQVSLIKQGAFEVVALRAMHIIDSANEVMTLCERDPDRQRPLSRAFVRRLPFMGSLFDGLFTFAREFKQLSLTERETGLLAAVTVVCADRTHTGDAAARRAVVQLQTLLLQALQMEICLNRSSMHANIMPRVIALVPQLRKLSNWHNSKLSDLRRQHPQELDKFPQLYNEIFSGIETSLITN